MTDNTLRLGTGPEYPWGGSLRQDWVGESKTLFSATLLVPQLVLARLLGAR